MSIIFFGTPDFAVPSLKALLSSGEDISLVVTQRDKVKGRGHKFSSPPVKIAAAEAGLRISQPETLRDERFLAELAPMFPEFVVVVAYGKILPGAILDLPKLGCINVHASLLPKYRGAAPIVYAIMNGERRTGVTTMLMDEGLDTGPVLLQHPVDIEKHDTAGSLSERLAVVGAELLLETLKGLRRGSVVPAPQAGEASYTRPLRKEDGLIDWSRSAVEIENRIRAMLPWPGAYCLVSGERVVLLKSEAINGEEEPGMIFRIDRGELVIGTGHGLLSVKDLQPAGKKAMSAQAFVIGRRLAKGLIIG